MSDTKDGAGRTTKKPNILLLLGGLLLVGGLVAAYLSFGGGETDGDSEAAARVQVLVAEADFDPGVSGLAIAAEQLYQVVDMDPGAVPPDALTGPLDLTGLTVAQPIKTGSVLAAGQFSEIPAAQLAFTTNGEIPDGHEALALTLPRDEAVAGLIQPGDEVVLYAITSGDPTSNLADEQSSSSRPSVQTLLRDVLVLDASRQPAPAAPVAGVDTNLGSVTFLLALTPEEVATVIYAQRFEGIYLAKPGEDPSSAPVDVDRLTVPSASDRG